MTHERHEYREDCPGCQMMIVDPATGRPVPEDSPIAKAAARVWASATLEEKRACNRVWVWNSREPADLRVAQDVAERVKGAVLS